MYHKTKNVLKKSLKVSAVCPCLVWPLKPDFQVTTTAAFKNYEVGIKVLADWKTGRALGSVVNEIKYVKI